MHETFRGTGSGLRCTGRHGRDRARPHARPHEGRCAVAAPAPPIRMPHDAAPAACITCGTPLSGRYCHECGERRLDPSDLRTVPFLRRMAGGVFDLDSRLWRTYRDLIARPGHLTAEFTRGRRKPYLHPLQAFLLANLVFFAVLTTYGGVNTFTTELRYHVGQPTYGEAARRLVARHGEPGSAEAAAYERRFDEATPRYANSMVILMVPLVALVLVIAYATRREPLVRHVVFALHFMAVLLLLMIALPLLFDLVRLVHAPTSDFLARDLPLSTLVLTTLSLWLVPALRRAYGDGLGAALARGVFVAFMTVPALVVYRMVLFFTVHQMIE